MTDDDDTSDAALTNALKPMLDRAYQRGMAQAHDAGITPLRMASGMAFAAFTRVMVDFVDKGALLTFLEHAAWFITNVRQTPGVTPGVPILIPQDKADQLIAVHVPAFTRLGKPDDVRAAELLFLLLARTEAEPESMREGLAGIFDVPDVT
jgi:hypothetical protein